LWSAIRYISIIRLSRLTLHYVVAIRIYAPCSRQQGISSGPTVPCEYGDCLRAYSGTVRSAWKWSIHTSTRIFIFSVAVHVWTSVHPPDSINVNNVFIDGAEQLTYLQDVTIWIKRVNEIFVDLYRFWRNEHILIKTKYIYLIVMLRWCCCVGTKYGQ
jgi:hypothetical protein